MVVEPDVKVAYQVPQVVRGLYKERDKGHVGAVPEEVFARRTRVAGHDAASGEKRRRVAGLRGWRVQHTVNRVGRKSSYPIHIVLRRLKCYKRASVRRAFLSSADVYRQTTVQVSRRRSRRGRSIKSYDGYDMAKSNRKCEARDRSIVRRSYP